MDRTCQHFCTAMSLVLSTKKCLVKLQSSMKRNWSGHSTWVKTWNLSLGNICYSKIFGRIAQPPFSSVSSPLCTDSPDLMVSDRMHINVLMDFLLSWWIGLPSLHWVTSFSFPSMYWNFWVFLFFISLFARLPVSCLSCSSMQQRYFFAAFHQLHWARKHSNRTRGTKDTIKYINTHTISQHSQHTWDPTLTRKHTFPHTLS